VPPCYRARVPLLLADLDNTLIERAGAFNRWAREFTSARGGSPADAQRLVAADRDGLESRERLAAMIGERLGPDGRARHAAPGQDIDEVQSRVLG
jgi:hypothetical protein